jgi:ribokinase
MTPRADRTSDQATGRVLVAGSINMDTVVTAPRQPRVGETLIGEGVSRHPGGKGSNQVVAAAASGAVTEFIGAVGDDEAGAQLRGFLEQRGVHTGHLRSIPGVDSGLAVVLVAAGDNSVVVVSGANAHLKPDALADLSIDPGDVLVSQFEIEVQTVEAFFERGKASGARTLLNPSPVHEFSERLLALSDVIVVNEIELVALGEARGLHGERDRLADLGSLIVRAGQAVVVTLGADGCVVTAGGKTTEIPGRATQVVDTTGAGDCFLGYMAGRLAAGDDLIESCRVANVASHLCVQRMGAGSSMPSAEEVAAAIAAGDH